MEASFPIWSWRSWNWLKSLGRADFLSRFTLRPSQLTDVLKWSSIERGSRARGGLSVKDISPLYYSQRRRGGGGTCGGMNDEAKRSRCKLRVSRRIYFFKDTVRDLAISPDAAVTAEQCERNQLTSNRIPK